MRNTSQAGDAVSSSDTVWNAYECDLFERALLPLWDIVDGVGNVGTVF